MNIDFSGEHVSIDLETVDMKSSAVILSVGVVVFDFAGTIYSRHEFYPSIAQQLLAGRTFDTETIKWWQKQDAKALAVFDVERAPVRAVLSTIAGITAGVNGVWGFGADFDNVKLMDLGMQFETTPWHYRKNRCGRTLISLAQGFEWPADVGAAHCAVDDAEAQAQGYVRAAGVISGLKP